MLLEFPAKEIDIWLEILQAESEEEKNINSEKNTTADDVRNFFRGKIKNGKDSKLCRNSVRFKH